MTSNSRRILHQRRWIKQQDQHSCVPVAILNLLKWAGLQVSYRKDFDYWRGQVNHTPADGAAIRHYVPILERIPHIMVERKTRPTLAEIDIALLGGSAVLLRSAWESNDEIRKHLLLIVGRTEKRWFLTNTFRGHAWFPIQAVETLYMEQHRLRSGIYPTAWFVRKRNAG